MTDAEIVCPECDQDGFKTRRGMHTHHTMVHGEPLIEHVTKTCAICGDEYDVATGDNPERRTSCGDPACRSEALARNGTDHGMWNGGKVEIECVVCGVSRRVYPSEAEKVSTCGRAACNSAAKRRANEGENHHSWTGKCVEIECAVCGTPHAIYPCDADRRQLCDDPDCFAEYFSELNKGERNPSWAGGKAPTYYGPNWSTQRRRALERDDYACRICGVGDDTHRDRFGMGLHVHHIVRFETFGIEQYERANRLANLVTMCLPHHNEWEGVPVVPAPNSD